MFNANFYPTPQSLTDKMFDKVNLKNTERHKKVRILEPSAGRGDLIEGFKTSWINHQEEVYKEYGWKHKEKIDADKQFKFDCIEIDTMLIDILKGKEYNVIHNDFLTFDGKYYDLILANFPFSQGCEHLLHAIRLQERVGGQIVCIINAETLKNTYSNNRKILTQLLDKYNADIEYIENAFVDAERSTNVEVALIYLDIKMQNKESMFEKEFNKENPDIKFEELRALTTKKSKIEQLNEECNIIKKSVSNLFLEKMRVENLLSSMGLDSGIKICENNTREYEELTINGYFEKIDLEYWNKMINETDLLNRLPSKLRDTFRNNMEIRRDIPFNLENALYFYQELMDSIPQSYETMCSAIFDKLTVESHYSKSDWCKNIHMYSGWKTNSAYKIGKKAIISYYNNGYMYGLPSELSDLIIIFENLSGIRNTLPREYTQNNVNEYDRVLEAIKRCEKNIDTKFMLIDSYKKGSLHLKFKNMDLVNKFNLIVNKQKQWLPPSFGEKSWNEMDVEERNAVVNFGIEPEQYAMLSSKQDYLRLMEG